ncbi:hypothetical protein PS6_011716 [Mucor atramentarius]
MGRFNNRMKRENRNVAALVLDNAPVHDRDLTYSNVKLVFLPPNITTSHWMQELLPPILKSTNINMLPSSISTPKKKSMTTLMMVVIMSMERKSQSHFFWIDQLQAMKWIVFASWNKVSEGITIANCWRHTGFFEQEKSFPDANAIEEMEKLDTLEGFIVHEDGTVEVEGQQFDLEKNEHLLEGEENSNSELNLSVNNEEVEEGEDGDEDTGVSSKAVADAMKLIY